MNSNSLSGSSKHEQDLATGESNKSDTDYFALALIILAVVLLLILILYSALTPIPILF